jgi:hypothetical protein
LGRTAVPDFQNGESLYRRYQAFHFQDGELDPSAIRFDEPPSFLRSAFSAPEDALHTDCADGQNVANYGVLEMKASVAQHKEKSKDGTEFDFSPVHRPLPTCYAHSEIRCSHLPDLKPQHIEPPKDVRKAFRLRIARALSVVIEAK